MSIELEPCPFCRGEGIVDPHDNDTWCTITCKKCGAKTAGFCSILEATEAWNTRALPAVQAERDELREALLSAAPYANRYGLPCVVERIEAALAKGSKS